MNRQVFFLVGPSGSGKTEVSVDLARRLGCEIISADSMLVYKGMDIGTAKPIRAARRAISHHLIDLVSPRSSFSVYRHRELALKAIASVLKRGRIPLVVGGSGLYVEALWKGLSGPESARSSSSEKFRRALEQKSTPGLYAKLRTADPERARQIHPHDRHRLLRALEIVHVTGKNPTEWYRQRESLDGLGYSVQVFGIRRERADLYGRINLRVEQMFRQGLLAEVKHLKKTGFSKTARQALGYREILEYLNLQGRGAIYGAPATLIQSIQQRTRQFAKRQLTWLRREKGIHWIDCAAGESAKQICDKIVKEIHG